MDQIKECAEAAGIEYTIEVGALIIWPKGGSQGDLVPLISSSTGMVGYPTMGGQNNIQITTLYNPHITYRSKIRVQSDIKPACGTWIVYTLSHELECEMPGGAWFTRLEASSPIQPLPVA